MLMLLSQHRNFKADRPSCMLGLSTAAHELASKFSCSIERIYLPHTSPTCILGKQPSIVRAFSLKGVFKHQEIEKMVLKHGPHPVFFFGFTLSHNINL